MYRVKQVSGGSLTLRDDGQVMEAMAMVCAEKMTEAGISESVHVS